MVANVEAMVRAGIEAYRAGKKSEARKLLEKAIELDDYNEQAWMWLSAVVETDEEKRTCLENVLVINPDNEEAKRGLKMIGVDGGSSAPAAATSEASTANPFTDTGMADFGDADFGDADFTSDSGDVWASPPTATSSASSVYQGPETTEQEYDSWVDNLNLGSSGADEMDIPETSSSSDNDPFGAPDMTDMFGLDAGDDIFGTDDPFGSEPMFDDDDDDFGSAATFTSGPFGGDSADDDFGFEDEPAPAPARSSKPVSSPVQSPGAENISKADDDIFSDLDSADFSGGDFFTGDEDFDSAGQPEFTPDELFSFIPEGVRATRLPGTKKGVGVGSIAILVVLVIMNLAALMFIISGIG